MLTKLYRARSTEQLNLKVNSVIQTDAELVYTAGISYVLAHHDVSPTYLDQLHVSKCDFENLKPSLAFSSMRKDDQSANLNQAEGAVRHQDQGTLQASS